MGKCTQKLGKFLLVQKKQQRGNSADFTNLNECVQGVQSDKAAMKRQQCHFERIKSSNKKDQK